MNIPKFTQADFAAIENARSKLDATYFIDEYVRIEDRDVEGIVIPFKLWESQKPVLDKFINERLVMVMKANQLGLTWLIISYGVWKSIFNQGFSVKAISDTETKAKEVVRRFEFILRHLPDWMISDNKDCGGVWYEATTLSVTVHHPKGEDSTVQAFASSPKVGAGFTANLFLFDEWALQEYAREIWTYAFPTINRPTGGQVLGISTIERGTLFEDIWRNNESFKKVFLGWFSDPRRNEAWYQNTLKQLGLDETRKHYPATPEEALAIPGGAFFNEFDSIVHLRNSEQPAEFWKRYRAIDYGLDMFACYFFWVDGEGYARIYKEIHKPGMVISEAAYEMHKLSGAKVPEDPLVWDRLKPEEKQKIALTATEKFVATYAPIDLSKKSQETGKGLDLTWYDNGVVLTLTPNKLEHGCQQMSQWLHVFSTRDAATGNEYKTAKLTIDKDSAPKLIHSLLNIQKDKTNAKIWSNQPHEYTHAVTAVMAFCTQIVPNAIDLKAREEEKNKFFRSLARPFAHPWFKGNKLSDRSLKM